MAVPQIRLKYLDRPLNEIHPWVKKILRLIPFKCMFERNIKLWGKLIHIPKLCSLNPLYRQIIDTKVRLKNEDQDKH